MRAMPAAAGHIASATEGSGQVMDGNPEGIAPTTLTPWSGNARKTDAAIAAPMAMSGTGERGTNFSKTPMIAKVATATTSVGPEVSGTWAAMDAMLWKNLALSMWMPRSFGI